MLADYLSHKEIILMGESTHETHEFYQYRELLTKKLVQNYSYNIVAIEADWPDAYKVNCYVKNLKGFTNYFNLLSGFKRFSS